MKGRPRKPTDVLKLHGGFRPDRHGDRKEPAASGKPVKPTFQVFETLDEVASTYWDSVVSKIAWAKEQDSAALQAMCEAWSLYQKTLPLAQAMPIDKETRCALLGYKAAWESLASKFGLTPADRTHIKIEEKKPKTIATRKRTG